MAALRLGPGPEAVQMLVRIDSNKFHLIARLALDWLSRGEKLTAEIETA